MIHDPLSCISSVKTYFVIYDNATTSIVARNVMIEMLVIFNILSNNTRFPSFSGIAKRSTFEFNYRPSDFRNALSYEISANKTALSNVSNAFKKVRLTSRAFSNLITRRTAELLYFLSFPAYGNLLLAFHRSKKSRYRLVVKSLTIPIYRLRRPNSETRAPVYTRLQEQKISVPISSRSGSSERRHLSLSLFLSLSEENQAFLIRIART